MVNGQRGLRHGLYRIVLVDAGEAADGEVAAEDSVVAQGGNGCGEFGVVARLEKEAATSLSKHLGECAVGRLDHWNSARPSFEDGEAFGFNVVGGYRQDIDALEKAGLAVAVGGTVIVDERCVFGQVLTVFGQIVAGGVEFDAVEAVVEAVGEAAAEPAAEAVVEAAAEEPAAEAAPAAEATEEQA